MAYRFSLYIKNDLKEVIQAYLSLLTLKSLKYFIS